MKKTQNYLDYIPEKVENISSRETEDGRTQLIIDRNSTLERILRKIIYIPEKYYVDLDPLGSFVWNNIDGDRSIFEISQMVKEEFQDQAEPLYERLIEYFVILKNNKFVRLK